MKNRTVTITVAASYDEVFRFLANPENLPTWALSFCKSIRKESESWIVATPQGARLAFAIDADRSSGCIEMLAGPTLDTLESFPVRVYKADSGETVASFTMFKSSRPGFSDAMFEMHFRALVKEVGSLVARFDGGEVSSGQSDLSSSYFGLVTKNVAVCRNFYVDNFGFDAVFDSPRYVHLERDSGSERIGLMAASDQACQAEFETATNGTGIWITLRVDDVDLEFERLKSKGLSFREKPTDQPWGERTCVTADPNGVLVYLSQLTEKMDESLRKYVVKSESNLAGLLD